MQPAIAHDDMRAVNRIFEDEVVAKGNLDALDRVYTLRARILPPGAPMITGRENIKQFWKAAIASMGLISGKLETVDAQREGDAIIEIGRATLNVAAGTFAEVKYVVVWRREDGAWKWDVDIWNPNA